MKQVDIKAIRNVALVGHGGSGKTSLTEALLFISGGIDRMGKVEDGNTVSDFDADEVKRKISINAAVAPVEWKGHKINVIDAPGYLDFVGDMVGALHVADAAVLVTPAQSAPEVGFDLALEYIERRGIARAVFISKMDRENADFETRLKELRERFGPRAVPVVVPIGAEAAFEGVIDLISMRAIRGVGAKATESEIPAALQEQVNRYHEWLEESAAEGDDELTLKYLEGEPLTPDEVRRGLKLGIASGKLMPVICGSAFNLNGLTALLDFIISEFPSPADIPPAKGKNPQTGQEETRQPSDSEPLAAFVFKTMADPYVGKLTYFRVMSGVLRSDSHVWNANKERDERVGQIFFLRGKQQEPTPAVHSGDIGAIAKLQETSSGDTLTDRAKPFILPPIEFPA
ncbi:MAG: GTP-binding protein, partial [Armatimonadota bacterium]|nr:GTP-binding protein [Armatimonadota bacterium]